jgi:type I restriction enzyme M protein
MNLAVHGLEGKNPEAITYYQDEYTLVGKFDPIAEVIRGLNKQVDLLCKLTARVANLGSELGMVESVADVYNRRGVGRLVRQLDEERKAAVEQLKHVAYFHRQAAGAFPQG